MSVKRIMAVGLLTLCISSGAGVVCKTNEFLGMTMITKMCYECILPIHIMGYPIMEGFMPGRKDPISPFYMCNLVPPIGGIPIGFYDPALSVEVVSDPMCFPTLGGGNSASGSQTGLYMGGSKGGTDVEAKATFYQAHILQTPLLGILDLFKSSLCQFLKPADDFDLLGFSELYPQWQDDELSAIMYPESALFAAPPLLLACIADSVAAQVYTPIDPLFWCKGSWGGTYPLSGNTFNKSLLEDVASVGAGAIAFEHRNGNNALWRSWGGDQAVMCGGRVPQPIWDKSAYRMQLMNPVPHPIASQIGEAGIVKQWSSGKWVPMAGDNFSFLLFRKTDCLVVLW